MTDGELRSHEAAERTRRDPASKHFFCLRVSEPRSRAYDLSLLCIILPIALPGCVSLHVCLGVEPQEKHIGPEPHLHDSSRQRSLFPDACRRMPHDSPDHLERLAQLQKQ